MKGRTKEKLQERGVTLVALVVSIVIIIILAGISINGVIGDGGIIAKAKNTKKEANERAAKEIIHRLVLEYDTVAKGETLENFLKRRVPDELDEVSNNGDGTIKVSKNGYSENVKEKYEEPPVTPSEKTVTVTFRAVNGTVSLSSATVTLYYEDGDLENGIGHLSVTQIPVATANAGYDQSSLSWTPETPTTTYEITGEMEFVAVFAPTPPTTPNTQ